MIISHKKSKKVNISKDIYNNGKNYIFTFRVTSLVKHIV
jgi:hypothetical protein